MLQFEDDGPLRDDDDLDAWDEDDDETPTRPCSHCGVEIYDDAVRCPVCGAYVTETESSVWRGRSILWIMLGALGVIATLFVLLHP